MSAGCVPAVVYGGGELAVSIWVSEKELRKIAISQDAYKPGTLDLGDLKITVLLKSVATSPIGALQHADFLDLDKAKSYSVFIPIKTCGTSPGVKRGGILSFGVTKLEVTSKRDISEIPEFIDVDISDMDIGSVLHVNKIKLPEGFAATNPIRDNTILSVVAPAAEKKKK